VCTRTAVIIVTAKDSAPQAALLLFEGVELLAVGRHMERELL